MKIQPPPGSSEYYDDGALPPLPSLKSLKERWTEALHNPYYWAAWIILLVFVAAVIIVAR